VYALRVSSVWERRGALDERVHGSRVEELIRRWSPLFPLSFPSSLPPFPSNALRPTRRRTGSRPKLYIYIYMLSQVHDRRFFEFKRWLHRLYTVSRAASADALAPSQLGKAGAAQPT
jgi:hypothetical protein